MRTRALVLIAALGVLLACKGTAQTFTTLHSFAAAHGTTGNVINSEGASPASGVILLDGILYGTAVVGGDWGFGTVYALKTDGTGFTNLHSFAGYPNDGDMPYAGLLPAGNTLYGATSLGGGSPSAWGAVFAISTNGTGLTFLHAFPSIFAAYTNGNETIYTNSEGAVPYGYGGLVLSSDTLFGTVNGGGYWGNGAVFRVNVNGTGFTNLHSFTAGSGSSQRLTNNDGAKPLSGLVLSGDTLYGTTITGGNSGAGTIFAVKTDGTDFRNLHNFTRNDGASPVGRLVLSGSTLFGTASDGGSSSNGTVFAVNTDGTDFRNLHSFAAGSKTVARIINSDGAQPDAGLVLSGYTLYGATGGGGRAGNGTVFSLNTDGTEFSTLYSFMAGSADGTNPDGANPNELALAGNSLYGTTSIGGRWGRGTVFKISFIPRLSISSSGTNVVLTWSTNYAGFDYTGYTFQSATNLASPIWSTNLPTPVIVNGLNTVTNPIPGTQQFFRLTQ